MVCSVIFVALKYAINMPEHGNMAIIMFFRGILFAVGRLFSEKIRIFCIMCSQVSGISFLFVVP